MFSPSKICKSSRGGKTHLISSITEQKVRTVHILYHFFKVYQNKVISITRIKYIRIQRIHNHPWRPNLFFFFLIPGYWLVQLTIVTERERAGNKTCFFLKKKYTHKKKNKIKIRSEELTTQKWWYELKSCYHECKSRIPKFPKTPIPIEIRTNIPINKTGYIPVYPLKISI